MRRIALLVLLVSGCGGNAGERSAVYLVDDWTGRLVRVERDVRLQPRGALRELWIGPTASERRRGLVTSLPRDTRLVAFLVRERNALVWLRATEPRPRRELHLTAQVVYTLTEHPWIDRVVLRLNGRRCCVYDRQSRPWRKPLDRRLFAGWQGAPEES